MCMNGKREAACLKKMRIRARGGEEKTRVYYTHACVFLEKVFKEKLLRPDRDVSFAEMDGAPVRFFVLLSLHYTTFVNHEWVSDASMRASGVSSFFSPLSLSLSKLLYARREVRRSFVTRRDRCLSISSKFASRAFFFLSRSKGSSLSFSASLIIEKVIIVKKWKSRIENQRYSRKLESLSKP